jgi:hypothetical protein
VDDVLDAAHLHASTYQRAPSVYIVTLPYLLTSLLTKMYASIELPRQLTRKSRTARRFGSKATQIQAGVPPRFTMVSSMNRVHAPAVHV